ncbi:MAG: YggS family pyridoxal phosphate-dependent enzyme [Candidatus Omnitrophota bacterium]|nr:YggS family pyridoxal phosphate-dependent enzyme [Candidatus Omnitrophota bacterium]
MIKENVSRIRQQILKVCSKINQDPGKITIIAVSKGRGAEEIKEAIAAGITDIGENKVQEALAKHKELSTIDYRLSTVKWHMVGHLQTNKVKDAVKIFDLIQSVDSVRLAEEIDKQADKINKIQDILIEIKTSPEESKFGLKADEAIEVIEDIVKLKNINIKGLMTIAPLVDNPEKTRPYFRLLRELRDRVNELRVLSMGMTEDFQIAIEEGSNMIRLGRAIFE